MVKCNKCKEKFEAEELEKENYDLFGTSLSLSCPHCGQKTSVAMADVAEDLGTKAREVKIFRDELIKERDEDEKEEGDEELDGDKGRYILSEPEEIDIRTPRDCLKTVLEDDPQLDDKEIKWLLKKTDNIYGGIMTINDLEKKVRQLNKKSMNQLCERLSDDYISIINTTLNQNPDLLRNEEWQRFLEKEPRAPDPEEIKEKESIEIRDTPKSNRNAGENMNQNISSLDDIDFNRYIKQQLDQMQKINMLKVLGQGNLPPELEKQIKNPNIEASLSNGDVTANVQEMLDKYINNMMMVNMLKSIQGNNGESNRAEQRTREELRDLKNDFNSLLEFVQKQNEQMQQLAQKERQEMSLRPAEKEEDEAEKFKKWATTLKDIEKALGGGNENRRRESDQVVNELRSLRNELRENIQRPSGQLNEYDAEVQKTQAQVEGEKTAAQLEHQARLKEAEERRKAIQALSSSVENAFRNFGESLGMGLANAPSRRSVPSPAEREQPQPPEQQTRGNAQVKRVFDEDGNETSRFMATCMQCGEEFEFEEGQSQVTCEHCGATYTPNPHQ